jgi:hypothetical protein
MLEGERLLSLQQKIDAKGDRTFPCGLTHYWKFMRRDS